MPRSLHDKLAFVRIPDKGKKKKKKKDGGGGGGDSATDEDQDSVTMIPWPCLYFASKAEMFSALKEADMIHPPTLEGWITTNLVTQYLCDDSIDDGCPVAFLLGSKLPGNRKAIYRLTNDDPPLDFADHTIEFKNRYADSDKRFSKALNEAIPILERGNEQLAGVWADGDISDSEGEEEEAGATNGTKKGEVAAGSGAGSAAEKGEECDPTKSTASGSAEHLPGPPPPIPPPPPIQQQQAESSPLVAAAAAPAAAEEVDDNRKPAATTTTTTTTTQQEEEELAAEVSTDAAAADRAAPTSTGCEKTAAETAPAEAAVQEGSAAMANNANSDASPPPDEEALVASAEAASKANEEDQEATKKAAPSALTTGKPPSLAKPSANAAVATSTESEAVAEGNEQPEDATMKAGPKTRSRSKPTSRAEPSAIATQTSSKTVSPGGASEIGGRESTCSTTTGTAEQHSSSSGAPEDDAAAEEEEDDDDFASANSSSSYFTCNSQKLPSPAPTEASRCSIKSVSGSAPGENAAPEKHPEPTETLRATTATTRPQKVRGRSASKKSTAKAAAAAAASSTKATDVGVMEKTTIRTPASKRGSSAKGTKRPSSSQSSSQKKKAKVTENIKISENIKIPTFKDVKPILAKAGYVFDKGCYCRPRVDGGLVDGTDRFEDERLFREHLCQNGVNGDISVWTVDEEDIVRQWVRYAIVRVDDKSRRKFFPERDALKWSQVWKHLQELGFKYSSTGLYILPGVPAKSRIIGKHAFPLDHEEGLKVYLARHGLPATCSFDKITSRERLSLELFLADEREVDTFEYTVDSKERTRPSSTVKRDFPDDATTVTHDSRVTSSKKPRRLSTSKGGAHEDEKARHTTRNRKTHATREEDGDAQSVRSTPVEDPALVVTSPLRRPRGQALPRLSISPLGEKDHTALPDTKTSCKEKLESCLGELNQHQPDGSRNLDIPENSQIGDSMQEVLGFITSVVDSEGGHSGGCEDDPAALYVCGGPGVGKTSAVLWCCEKVAKERENGGDLASWTPIKAYINVNHILGGQKGSGAKKAVRDEVAKILGLKKNYSKDHIQKHLKKNRKVLILVLDEVDALIQDSSGTGSAEKELQTVASWANDDNFPMALIGISNTTGDAKFERIQNVGKFQNVSFKRYKKEDLLHILMSRVGVSTVAKPVLEFIARKVSRGSGDARTAFGDLSEAVKLCMASMPESKLLETASSPLVKMKDIMAFYHVKSREIPQLVAALPQSAKSILCVLTALAQVNVKRTTIANLKSFSNKCIEKQGGRLENDEFLQLLATLQDQGLLSIEGTNLHSQSLAGIVSQPVSLGVQLEDVVKAVDDELCESSGFFTTLREMAQKNRNELETIPQEDLNA